MRNPELFREVRGVMTRFEPLTEEIVDACTQDGLTYQELSDVLSDYGLYIEKVVHDPTRKFFTLSMLTMNWACMQRSFCRGTTYMDPVAYSFVNWPSKEEFAGRWLLRIGVGSI